MANRVLLISGAGFLGRHLACQMRTTSPVVVCDSTTRLERAGLSGVESCAYEFGQDDPNHVECLPGDVAVIFSWRGYPAAHESDPAGRLSRNLGHTLALVKHLAESGVCQVLYASSGGAVYGNAGRQPVTETALPHPLGYYGIGKLTAEMIVRKILEQHSKDYLILRIGNAYGAGQITDNLSVGFVARAIQAANTGQQLELWGDGEIRRDYIYVRDIADAIGAALLSSSIASGTYNIGTGIALSRMEVIRTVEETLSKTIHVRQTPGRSFDVDSICLDSTALRSACGWSPSWSLAEGILDLQRSLGQT